MRPQKASYLVWPLLAIPAARAGCYDPSPAFPVPSWSSGTKPFGYALASLGSQLQEFISDPKYNTSSYSIEVTSSTETLWTNYHTATWRNQSRPGAEKVDGDSFYRIASISKTFTTLAILQQANAGNLSLDDPVDKYIPELAGDVSGPIPWNDITIRALASQLSGIPRDIGQSDLRSSPKERAEYGLPLVDDSNLRSPCGEFNNFTRTCTREDLIDILRHSEPLFAPNFKSTYSNVNFELLGLVIESVSGLPYEEYVQKNIFDAVGIEHGATFTTPNESRAVLPVDGDRKTTAKYWDVDLGVLKPTGGIYASSSALSAFLRHVLAHYNSLARENWFLPHSFVNDQSYYGMPWEMYRSPVQSKGNARSVTFVTKAGDLPGYSTVIVLLPEYGIGVTVLTTAEPAPIHQLLELVIATLVPALERTAWYEIDEVYAGDYQFAAVVQEDAMGIHSSRLNTSLTLAASLQAGLQVTSFISNSTNVLAKMLPESEEGKVTAHLQLVPTLLYKNETAKQGEKWRVIPVPERSRQSEGIFSEFCSTNDDGASYAGQSLNEVIFWHESEEIELPAWRVKVKKVKVMGDETLNKGPILVHQNQHADL